VINGCYFAELMEVCIEQDMASREKYRAYAVCISRLWDFCDCFCCLLFRSGGMGVDESYGALLQSSVKSQVS
jgi:hypothetical protein